MVERNGMRRNAENDDEIYAKGKKEKKGEARRWKYVLESGGTNEGRNKLIADIHFFLRFFFLDRISSFSAVARERMFFQYWRLLFSSV